MSQRPGERCRRMYFALRLNRAKILRKELLGAAAIGVACAAVLNWILPAPLSLVWIGMALVALPVFLWQLLGHPDDRPWRDGYFGELFTSDELGRLRRGGWKRTNTLLFDGFDVDHVGVGPPGVVVIEAKWTNHSWPIVDGRFDSWHATQAVLQAKRSAQTTRNLLRSKGCHPLPVLPVLAVWGPGQPKVEAAVEIDGVIVVSGQHLVKTLRALPAEMSRTEIKSAHRILRRFQKVRREYESGKVKMALA